MLKVNYSKLLLILVVFFGVQLMDSTTLFGESGGGQIGDLTQVQSQVRTTVNTIRTIVNYVFGAAIFIGSIGAVYEAVSGGQRTKQFIIGIVVAVIVVAIVNIIVPSV